MSHVVLLTGASGGFGSQLLGALAARDDVSLVYGLAHQSPLPPGTPKVRALHGDVTRPDLGLAPAEIDRLTEEVTGVLHAAADTRFLVSLEATRAINVSGTRNVFELAARCRHLDRVCHLSTVYVAGRRTGTILEPELEHLEGFVNPYEQAKYESEQLAREWMRQLPLLVIRLSTIIDNVPAVRLGAIHHAMRLMYGSLAPMVPGRADHPVDLLPIDYAVSAVTTLFAAAFHPGLSCHICAGTDTLSLGELLDRTMDAFLRFRPAWRRRAIERPSLVDLETFELFRRSVDEVGDPVLRESAAVIGSFAPQLAFPKIFDDAVTRGLLATSGIIRPAVRDCLTRTVRYLVETGWATQEPGAAALA